MNPSNTPPPPTQDDGSANPPFVLEVSAKDRNNGFLTLGNEWLKKINPPQGIDRIAQQVGDRGVLVIGGPCDDKRRFAHAVAYCIVSDNPALAQYNDYKVREWQPGALSENLLREVRQEESPAVLLLCDIHPRQLDYGLRSLKEVADQRKHLILITTDRPRGSWGSPGQGLEAFWYEAPLEQQFSAETLKTHLVNALERVRAHLPPGIYREDKRLNEHLLFGRSLLDIAGKLRTTRFIDIFVERLHTQKEKPLGPRDLDALIKSSTSNQDWIINWLRKSNLDEQILAIGLSLFEGLFDDQFFAALDQWVKHIREHRNPTQRTFDYADAHLMQNMFDLVETESDGMKFRGRESRTRQFLLQEAWRTHRRLIMGGLPVLTELALSAGHHHFGDRELYTTFERCEQIRYCVGNALSLIGRLSWSTAEYSLLRLACHPNLEVQSVAARAMALWREEEDDDKAAAGEEDAQKKEDSAQTKLLFKTLEFWRTNVRLSEILQSILEEQKDGRSASGCILSTIALTVAYASAYDRPNNLHSKLLIQLKLLADEENPLVRSRFAGMTLPLVARRHLKQLWETGVLLDVMQHADLTWCLGGSLAYAARSDASRVVGEILDAWHEETRRTRPDNFFPGELTQRDRMLMTLAAAYGQLDYTRGGALTEEKGFTRLREILGGESHPLVRQEAIRALCLQMKRRFAQAEPWLREVVRDTTLQEHEVIVQALVVIYLKQRAELKGGNSTWTRAEGDHRQFPVWLHSNRPQLTSVEELLLLWLQDAENLAAQRIALRAALAFARNMDEPETRSISKFHDVKRKEEALEKNTRLPTAPTRVVHSTRYTRQVVPWVVTGGRSPDWKIIGGLLPEALSIQRRREWRSTFLFLMDHWPKVWGEEAGDIARQLQRALSWHPHLWKVLTGGGFILGLVLLRLYFLFH